MQIGKNCFERGKGYLNMMTWPTWALWLSMSETLLTTKTLASYVLTSIYCTDVNDVFMHRVSVTSIHIQFVMQIHINVATHQWWI